MASRQRAAVWLRVSDREQELDNQRVKLDEFCEHRGHRIVRMFTLDGVSGFSDDPRYNAVLAESLDAARRREFDVLVVWALDRLTRRGVEHITSLMRRFQEFGVRVVSQQESWTKVDGELRELLVAVVGWAARSSPGGSARGRGPDWRGVRLRVSRWAGSPGRRTKRVGGAGLGITSGGSGRELPANKGDYPIPTSRWVRVPRRGLLITCGCMLPVAVGARVDARLRGGQTSPMGIEEWSRVYESA